MLTRKQRFLNTFEGKKVDQLSFSPRLYYWYGKNRHHLNPGRFHKQAPNQSGTVIPAKYYNKSQMQIYDMLGATPRYPLETSNIPLTSVAHVPNPLKAWPIFKRLPDGGSIFKFKTKFGTLTQRNGPAGGGLGSTIQDFFIKEIDDLKTATYIIQNSTYYVFTPFIKYAQHFWADRGVISAFVWHSPYQRCILDLIGFRRTHLFLHRYPQEMAEFMQVLSNIDDHLYKKIAHSAIPVINFGENIDANLTPPPIFEKYCLPYYEQRVKELHQAGKYCHIHMDGDLKDLMPFIPHLPFDAIEAVTFKPTGDVTMEEFKDALGNKILMDGVPSPLFLPEYTHDYFILYVKKVIETFSPRLILGVSDELPPNGEIQKIELMINHLAPP